MEYQRYAKKVPYPKKPIKPQLNSTTPSTAEIKQYQNDVADFEIKEIDFKIALQKAQEEEGRLNDLFKQDLFAILGITKHPKKDKIFAFAWELGHGSGPQEVANYAKDIVDNLFDGEREPIAP
jgi:hypothetical protein